MYSVLGLNTDYLITSMNWSTFTFVYKSKQLSSMHALHLIASFLKKKKKKRKKFNSSYLWSASPT